MSAPESNKVKKGGVPSESYQVPRYDRYSTRSGCAQIKPGPQHPSYKTATFGHQKAVMVLEFKLGVWTLFTDGASNVKGSRLGLVLVMPSGETLRQAIRSVLLTNNEAKYEALIAELELARELDSEVIEIKCDSQLVVN
uniref:Uncharacterized protein LOC104224098 n=1 Tax=Nicotiana sylvestris TaxID=4096 RepID=A0A1U7WH67_NICSY|nr:PREDICTED: uncharacterized protein LOC104224098 [Nicotiana sylvestris]